MNHSDTIAELAKALCKFQGEVTQPVKNKVNPGFHYKYADLTSILQAIQKPLLENGLSISQPMIETDGKTILETVLFHISGEWLRGEMLLHPVKDDPQAQGSALTYARRYSLSSILGISADDDDDAESATDRGKKTQKPTESRPLQSQEKPPVAIAQDTKEQMPSGLATTKQLAKLHVLMTEKSIDREKVVRHCQIEYGIKESSKELTIDQASALIDLLETNAQLTTEEKA